MSRKAAKKLKWMEQMNKDVLDCKRRAMEMTSSGNPPQNENGRKRGYIEVMKRLWDKMGYEMLGIKAQNLRDQAARLEGLQESSEDITLQESRATNDLGNTRPPTRITISDDENNQNFQRQERQNANFPPNDSLDLHTNPPLVSGEHQDIERDETIDENPFAEVAGSLPEFSTVDMPQSIVWGQSEGKVLYHS